MRSVLFLPFVFLALLSSCGGDRTPSAWQPYREAEAVPGQGLGDIRLGSQRLGSMIDQFGVERVSGWFTEEETGIELIYGSVGLHFMFPMQGECARATRALGHRMVRELHQASDFFVRYPACRELTLNSIVIVSGLRSVWWEGSTNRGARMGDLWPEVVARHRDGRQFSHSSLQQVHRESFESMLIEDGMQLFFRTLGSGPPGPADRLLMPLVHVRLFEPHDD